MGVAYAAWGLFGGFAVEGLEFTGAIRRTGGWPWKEPGEPGPLPLLVSVLVRLAVGSGLATAAGVTGQLSGPFGAVAIGIAAPLLVEQLARQIPVTAGPAIARNTLTSSTSDGAAVDPDIKSALHAGSENAS